PILDWGRGRGQVRVARSNRDLVHTQVEQDKTDFDLNVRKLVKQFNLQAQRVSIAARTDNTAQRRAEVARKLYLLGKSSILDLNASVTEKDAARRNYISALHNFWSLYYTLRSITLYDFEKRITLTEDLENVINNKDMLHEAPQLRTSTQERTYLKEESS
ncbi:MAG: TolC family protein, partial [Bacteroides sp.]|nr:TolC family protein [Bacteroides sp.]